MAPFYFPYLAVIAEQSPVELLTVGNLGVRHDAVAESPVPRVQFLYDPPGVAARIGWIIPCAVVHYAPSHKLSARVMSVVVVVEEIGDRESTGIDRIAIHRPLAGELVFIAFLALHLLTESEVVLKIQ